MATMMETILMDYLTPLGILIYGIKLKWWEAQQRGILSKNPTHIDLNESIYEIHRLTNILTRTR